MWLGRLRSSSDATREKNPRDWFFSLPLDQKGWQYRPRGSVRCWLDMSRLSRPVRDLLLLLLCLVDESYKVAAAAAACAQYPFNAQAAPTQLNLAMAAGLSLGPHPLGKSLRRTTPRIDIAQIDDGAHIHLGRPRALTPWSPLSRCIDKGGVDVTSFNC